MTLPAWTWVAVTLFAVIMQTIRTAGQKQLTAHLDAITVTLVRFLFGLPFAVLYLLTVNHLSSSFLPPLNSTFLIFATIAAVAQIIATVLLISLFSLRNFAVGTTYARTEAFLTALLGVFLFAEHISLFGWLAIVISVAGVIVLTVARSELGDAGWLFRLWNRAALIGVGSGLFFAIASLSLRTASLSFELDAPLLTAGITLVAMIVIQTALMLIYVSLKQVGQLIIMIRQWRLGLFVGLTSALGSMGWFIAMTLERASYVKALGQIEFLFALGVSTLFFRERSTRLELYAMTLIAGGLIILIALG